jgi:hypothetical protein
MVPEVDVGVGGGVFVGVAALVEVPVGRAVAVLAGVLVGDAAMLVGVGVPASVMTSSGALAPSRDENIAPSVLSGNRAKVYAPLFVTTDVTS